MISSHDPYKNQVYTEDEIDMWIEYGENLRKLREENPEKLHEFISSLTDDEAHEIMNNPYVKLRPKQVWRPDRHKPTTLICAGRGLNY